MSLLSYTQSKGDNMALQDKAHDMGAAKAGQILKGLHSNFAGHCAPVKDNSVCVGCFVQNDGKFVKGASGVAITGKIMGIAIAGTYITSDVSTQVYPTENIAFFANKGCIAIETETPAKVGQYVFLKTADGELAFGDSETLADHTYTGFRVVYGTGDAVTYPEIIGVEA